MLLSKEELLAEIKKPSGIYLDRISQESLIEAGLCPYVALLPENFKDRLRYMGNLLVQISFNCNTKLKNESLKIELTCITTALSYLLNSYSFEHDEYKNFDKEEIDRKLLRKENA